jgi:RNA polymerase sigma factor for flagellar operon FliA
LGRGPQDRELANHLNVDMKTFWRWQSDAESIVRVSLDRPKQDTDRRQTSPVESLADSEDWNIEDIITHEEEVEQLKSAIMELKEQERVVLTLYYFEELKLHQIAAVLDLTESRVSQIRSKAISKLRVMLASLRQPAVA